MTRASSNRTVTAAEPVAQILVTMITMTISMDVSMTGPLEGIHTVVTLVQERLCVMTRASRMINNMMSNISIVTSMMAAVAGDMASRDMVPLHRSLVMAPTEEFVLIILFMNLIKLFLELRFTISILDIIDQIELPFLPVLVDQLDFSHGNLSLLEVKVKLHIQAPLGHGQAGQHEQRQ